MFEKVKRFFLQTSLLAVCLLCILIFTSMFTLPKTSKELEKRQQAIIARIQPQEKVKQTFCQQLKTKETSIKAQPEACGKIEENILKIKFSGRSEQYIAGIQLALSVLLKEYSSSGALSFLVKMPQSLLQERDMEIYLQEWTGERRLIKSSCRQNIGPDWTQVIVPLNKFACPQGRVLSWEIRNFLFSLNDFSQADEELWIKNIKIEQENQVLYEIF